MTPSKDISQDPLIGERLRIVREAAKITQAAAAEKIGAARTTLIAIEQGKRKIKLEEIQLLAALYKTSVNALLRQESIHLDMTPQFRKLAETDHSSITDAAILLNKLVQAEVELENCLGVVRPKNYPPERPLLPGNVATQAETDAQDLRNWLSLGSGPVGDMVSILSLQIGMRVYLRKLSGNISGLFSYHENVGACVLVNAHHPIERIQQTCAHELAHFIATRNQPEALTINETFSSREERYANIFQRSFLTPARAVQQKFADITAGHTHLTRRHIILLAHAFQVSREAITRRLEELNLAKTGTWDWFKDNGGITDEQAKQVLGDKHPPQPNLSEGKYLLPSRLALLAREAWKRDLFSEGQLSKLLMLDRHQVREVLDGVEMEENEANDLVKLPN
ncbi:ImmA/IrrE family metallo-endopeptidase [Thalassospira australica]|uniref:ImmA/IrrE family metallo-endopeptidase n=1 Tax=Thalassospira australica TaxID=1528106 RepID=UPI0038515889